MNIKKYLVITIIISNVALLGKFLFFFDAKEPKAMMKRRKH